MAKGNSGLEKGTQIAQIEWAERMPVRYNASEGPNRLRLTIFQLGEAIRLSMPSSGWMMLGSAIATEHSFPLSNRSYKTLDTFGRREPNDDPRGLGRGFEFCTLEVNAASVVDLPIGGSDEEMELASEVGYDAGATDILMYDEFRSLIVRVLVAYMKFGQTWNPRAMLGDDQAILGACH